MNKIDCCIKSVFSEGSLHDIRALAGKEEMRILTLEPPEQIREGIRSQLLFKETEVVLSRHPCEFLSIANRIVCQVEEIRRGRLLCELTLSASFGHLQTVVFSDWEKAQNIQAGNFVTAMIRATDISLMALSGG